MPRRCDELKGISDDCAATICGLASLDIPKLGDEVEIGDGFYLRHTNLSVVEGRGGDGPWNFWIVFENRAQIPTYLIMALANFVMQQERKKQKCVEVLDEMGVLTVLDFQRQDRGLLFGAVSGWHQKLKALIG